MAKATGTLHAETRVMTEKNRIQEMENCVKPWRLWRPYLSERQWGTVREDYSESGTAWDYFNHDHARSRAYRWGEDGIAGISDGEQRLCVALALWNGHDPILKERLFGLTNGEGNHGEDVKEIYYYLDATPTHSYLKMLYKYPQRAFPYTWLLEENRGRNQAQPEFELIDTDASNENRYFDVFVEYAKAGPDDILMQITVCNRGPEAADIEVLPQIWFRNTWSWGYGDRKPELRRLNQGEIAATHESLGEYRFYVDGSPQLLFTENETNTRRLFAYGSGGNYYKDAFHEAIVDRRPDAVNPAQIGTKAAAHYRMSVPAGDQRLVRVRLRRGQCEEPFDTFHRLIASRRREADEFYSQLQESVSESECRNIQRQALAGMIWSKQFYYYDVRQWLKGDPCQPAPPESRKYGRNSEWTHLNNGEIVSMPDKWEYPWYAAWDLAFPHGRPGSGGSRFCEATNRAYHARVVHASKRAATGL